jgi:hypothetical protein
VGFQVTLGGWLAVFNQQNQQTWGFQWIELNHLKWGYKYHEYEPWVGGFKYVLC